MHCIPVHNCTYCAEIIIVTPTVKITDIDICMLYHPRGYHDPIYDPSYGQSQLKVTFPRPFSFIRGKREGPSQPDHQTVCTRSLEESSRTRNLLYQLPGTYICRAIDWSCNHQKVAALKTNRTNKLSTMHSPASLFICKRTEIPHIVIHQ